MALKYVMINDIIEEHNARMQNLRKYYPFFVLAETTFAQYKEGRYAQLDMGYITMAILRFFIQENSFNEREVSYDEYEEFMGQLLDRDFDVEIAEILGKTPKAVDNALRRIRKKMKRCFGES